jgi:tetratricopeptide (TPR) repeat protein/tRNA A-37 threonylcarbamoyl transferase component Bud32
MSEDFWVDVEEAYNQAAELPPNARTTFLDKAYRDRADIRREVESLLEHQEVAQQLRQSTVMMAAAEMFGDDEKGLIGQIIADKYLIREFLGAGGMAEVYLADHIALQMPFALKRPRPVLRLDPEFRKRFLDEARRAVILKHENVTRVHDVIDADDDMFVVMEYIEGDTLERRIQDLARPFTIDEFLPIAVQCGAALVAAHEKRIAHLDVKPANIMLTPAGQVKFCDFGVARRLSSDTTTTTTALSNSRWVLAGTPAYMAPEVILSSPFDERADLFSLGTVFYEMLTGQNPFRADTAIATTAKVVSHNPEPISATRPGFDPRLERIVTRMMAKDPDQRYASAANFVEDLTSLSRARSRFQDLSRGFREAFAESRWMKVAAAVVLLCIAAMPPAIVYREPILQALGLAPIKLEKNLVPLQIRAIGTGENIHVYADGLTETVNSKLTQLTQGSEWRVAPTALVRDQGVTTPEAARKELAADLVFEGSMEVAGDAVRVNVKLIDMATSKSQSRTFDGLMSDPFGVQDKAVSKLVDMLGLELKTSADRTIADYQTWPPKAKEYYILGRGYLLHYEQPENVESAIDVFHQAIDEYPRFALAYAGLGQAHWYKFRVQFDKGQLDEASSACERSAMFDSKLPEAHICLGNIYNSKGEHERALEQFQQARSGPEFDVLTGLAEAYEGLAIYDLAEEHLKQAVAQNRFNWIAYGRLGSFYSRRARFEAAEDLWRQAIERSKDNPRALSTLGAILLRMGKLQDAERVLERAITLRGTLAAYSNLGLTYLRMGQFEKSVANFQKAVEIGKDYRVAGNLARAYYFIPDKKADAIEMYKRAIELGNEELSVNRRNADVHILLARYHAMLLQTRPALDHLRAALDWDPDDWHYLEIAAIVHNQFNDPDTTLKYLEKALSRGFTTLEMRSEMEFSNLHQLPKFQALLQTNPSRP